jgi:hypothetical protein
VTKWFGSTRSGEESNLSIGDRIEHASSCLAQMDALPLARALISSVLNELCEGTGLDLKYTPCSVFPDHKGRPHYISNSFGLLLPAIARSVSVFSPICIIHGGHRIWLPASLRND